MRRPLRRLSRNTKAASGSNEGVMQKFAIFAVLTMAVAGYGLYLLFPAAFKPSPGGGRKRWAYLFGIVLTVEALVFVLAPIMNWWLPKSASSYSGGIDDLF